MGVAWSVKGALPTFEYWSAWETVYHAIDQGCRKRSSKKHFNSFHRHAELSVL